MLNPEDYTIICAWFPRLLGLVYLFAFWPFLFQIKGLLGEGGILPVSSYLGWIKRLRPKDYYKISPTLFWLRSDDKALFCVTMAGVICSIFLIFGIYPTMMLFALFILYFSIISVGQDFLSFGWEVLLQEIALNTFVLSLTPVPNLMAWISINFLLFRFHIQSGAVKLQSGDPNWRNCTAISYHYESQPIPNTLAWYVHKMPMWFHKLSCYIMFAIELIVPLFIFLSDDFRLAACVLFVALQLFIYLTGNFSYLNHMTAVFSLILLSNNFLEKAGFHAPPIEASPLWLDISLTLLGTLLLLLQIARFWDHFFPTRQLHTLLNKVSLFYIANRYGIFAVMTTTRYEVVVEGSSDGLDWQEYDFYHKPGSLFRRPRRISPYQPRLDWQVWFLPFSHFSEEEWFQGFLLHLLKGSKEVLKLLRHNPFPDSPPKYIRAQMYVYTFTSFKEKQQTGAWWRRTFIGPYCPSYSLSVHPHQSL